MPGVTQVDERDTKQESQLVCVGGNMVKETAGQEEFLLTAVIRFEHLKKYTDVSCEIEDFVETRLCKLFAILPSRVLWVWSRLVRVAPRWWCRWRTTGGVIAG